MIFGRVLVGLFFLLGGLNKLMNPADTASYMEMFNIPMAGILVWVAGIFLVIASLALIAGKKQCLAAGLLAAFTILVTLIFHMDFADEIQKIMFMKNMAITGALLYMMGMCKGSCSG